VKAVDLLTVRAKGVVSVSLPLLQAQLKVLEKNHPEYQYWRKCAKSLYNIINNIDEYGPLDKRRQEIETTAFFSSLMQEQYARSLGPHEIPSIAWAHQIRSGRGSMDICGFARVNKGWMPRVVWEFSVNSANKEDQLFAYCNNLTPLLPSGQWLICLGVVIVATNSPTIALLGYYQSIDESSQQSKLSEVKLYESLLNKKSLARVLWTIDWWMKLPNDAFLCQTLPPSYRRNVLIDTAQDLVYKVMDYRFRRGVSSTRRYEFSIRYLPNCQLVASEDDFKVISYKYIPGKHYPENALQVYYLLKMLTTMHKDGIVHGDIRLSNIIFAENPSETQLIDFDYSGARLKDVYPLRFALEINDGKRHKKVKPLGYLRRKHDCFSMYFLLMDFGPCDSRNHIATNWKDVCELVGAGKVERACECLWEFFRNEEGGVYSLTFCRQGERDHTSEIQGTGSPDEWVVHDRPKIQLVEVDEETRTVTKKPRFLE
jgi:serine/threonine protein kinase